MKRKVNIIVFLFTLGFGCCNFEEKKPLTQPCQCDLLGEKEKYFIKEGVLTETNSNVKAMQEGKEAEVEITVDAAPDKMIKELGKLKFGGKLRVPLIDFDKYEYVYEFSREDNDFDRNMQLYFLSYCSYYSAHHKKNNSCEPDSIWESKVDALQKIYLMPEKNTHKTSQTPKTTVNGILNKENPKSVSVTDGKSSIKISGKIMNPKKSEQVKIYFENNEIGTTSPNGGFYVNISSSLNRTISLRFESANCGEVTKEILLNDAIISDVPIKLPCK